MPLNRQLALRFNAQADLYGEASAQYERRFVTARFQTPIDADWPVHLCKLFDPQDAFESVGTLAAKFLKGRLGAGGETRLL